MSAEFLRLQIECVSKTYGARRVLRSVSAELHAGDILLVTGRNGAGKSTLLRIIAGLLRPSEGAVHFWRDGVLLSSERRRHAFGYVGADVQLYRELTAGEHIDLVARLRGLPDSPTALAAALDRVGLGGRESEPISGYSSGMLQRLRYALALLHRPRVLLLDEPTTNLDQAGVAIASAIIAEIGRQGIVVIATNDPRDMCYGDLQLALDRGDDG